MPATTRIRYIKNADGHLVTQEFLGGLHLFKGLITLDGSKNVFLLRNKEGEYKAVTAMQYTNLTDAKRKIKSFLKERGVTFYEEVRRKKKKR